MWNKSANKPQHGMTLIELILAIVIISIALAGVMTVFNVTIKSSADPMINKQMTAIAEELMEEIVAKPFEITANTAVTGCDRSTFNDVRDFHNYGDGLTGICDDGGAALTALADYSVLVEIEQTTLGSATYTITSPETPPNPTDAAEPGALKITVTVNRGSTNSFELIGWRTNYAD